MSSSAPHLPDLVRQSATLPSNFSIFCKHGKKNGYSNLHDDNQINYFKLPRISEVKPFESKTSGMLAQPDIINHSRHQNLNSHEKLGLRQNTNSLSQTLPNIPTRRNVKPHLPFPKRKSDATERHSINGMSHLRTLHQPLLGALPTYIPREQRKLLREQMLSEVTNRGDIFKNKEGGDCIVLDTSSKVNGLPFLSLWRSTSENESYDKPQVSTVAQMRSKFDRNCQKNSLTPKVRNQQGNELLEILEKGKSSFSVQTLTLGINFDKVAGKLTTRIFSF